jgi:hypothetical protein
MGVWRLRYEKDGLARIEELESSKLKLQVPKITLFKENTLNKIFLYFLVDVAF